MSRLQATPEIETKRADEVVKKRRRLYVVKKDLKAQMRHEKGDNKELEDLQYKFDGGISEKRQAKDTKTTSQSRLPPAWSVMKGFPQHLAKYTERCTADHIEYFSAFLYDLRKKAQSLVKKQQNDTQSTIKTTRKARHRPLSQENVNTCGYKFWALPAS